MSQPPSASTPKLCNPAVVGLAGFGLTTLVLQLHNLGLVGLGPVIWLGLIFGGLTQMIAGLQEMKTGNNFGYCAFTSYGAFWIALCLMLLAGQFGLLKPTTTDVGWFLVAWTLLSAILWIGALRIHGAMALTFTLLMVGFVLLDLGHFGFPALNTVAAYVLIACAFSAWYMMARILLNEIYGRELLPAGRPWVGGPAKAPVATAPAAVGARA
ncbi:MAG: acetate uptake transporter [Verrucomicrobiota bacterium]